MNRLREARVRSGLSQKQVAAELQLCKQSVSAWESGRAFPSPVNLDRLSTLYKTTPDYLMGASDIPSNITPDPPTPVSFDPQLMTFMSEAARLSESERSEVGLFMEFLLAKRQRTKESLPRPDSDP